MSHGLPPWLRQTKKSFTAVSRFDEASNTVLFCELVTTSPCSSHFGQQKHLGMLRLVSGKSLNLANESESNARRVLEPANLAFPQSIFFIAVATPALKVVPPVEPVCTFGAHVHRRGTWLNATTKHTADC